jgi:hypothetical protein
MIRRGSCCVPGRPIRSFSPTKDPVFGKLGRGNQPCFLNCKQSATSYELGGSKNHLDFQGPRLLVAAPYAGARKKAHSNVQVTAYSSASRTDATGEPASSQKSWLFMQRSSLTPCEVLFFFLAGFPRGPIAMLPPNDIRRCASLGVNRLEWCGEHSLFGKAITCVAATTLLEQGMEDQRVGSDNGLGNQCFGLASGLPLYLLKEVIGLSQSEGGCHAVHTVSRVDGAGPLLRYVG